MHFEQFNRLKLKYPPPRPLRRLRGWMVWFPSYWWCGGGGYIVGCDWRSQEDAIEGKNKDAIEWIFILEESIKCSERESEQWTERVSQCERASVRTCMHACARVRTHARARCTFRKRAPSAKKYNNKYNKNNNKKYNYKYSIHLFYFFFTKKIKVQLLLTYRRRRRQWRPTNVASMQRDDATQTRHAS